MTYIIKAFKEDVLQSDISAGATSATLVSGNFGTISGTQLLVLDYDVPASREIVKVTIGGTALTSMTRAIDGTSAVAHTAGAKILMAFVPTYYGDLGKIAAADVWSDWTPAVTASGSMTIGSLAISAAKYVQLGKMIFYRLDLSYTTGGSGAAAIFVTPPVTAKDVLGSPGSGLVIDDTGAARAAFTYWNSTTSIGVQRYDIANFSIGSGKALRITGCYESA